MFNMKLLFLLFLSTVLNASNPLTLGEALLILKSENLAIKSASIKVDTAKIDVKNSSASYLGRLDFIQDYANSNEAGNVFGFKLTSREVVGGDLALDTLNFPDSRNFFKSKLKYEVPLFTGFKISSYVKTLKNMARMKGLEKEQIINEKSYQLKKSYYDIALLLNSVENLNKILKNIKTLENMTTRMVEVGYAKKVDLLEVQAKKGNIQRLILQMKSNQKLLLHYISFLLNIKVENIIVPDSDIRMSKYDDLNILENNLDIKRATTGLAITKNMITISKSSYYPTVGGFAEISTANDTFLEDANKNKSYSVGARMTWNIFNGGIDNLKIEKSKLEYLKSNIDLNYAKQGIALKIAKIRTEIETFDSEIISLRKELILLMKFTKTTQVGIEKNYLL